MTADVLVLSRLFHLGSGLMLVAVVAFRWLILLPSWKGEPEESWGRLSRLELERLLLGSGVVLILSSLTLFWAISAGMSDTSLAESLNFVTCKTVLLSTQFGHVSIGRFSLEIVLGMLLAGLRRSTGKQARPAPAALEIAAGFITVALLVSFAFTGHAAASQGGLFVWNVTADALHLVAAAVWPAGLLPFGIFLAEANRAGSISSSVVARVVRRFSRVSLMVVGILTITGIVNSYSWWGVSSPFSVRLMGEFSV